MHSWSKNCLAACQQSLLAGGSRLKGQPGMQACSRLAVQRVYTCAGAQEPLHNLTAGPQSKGVSFMSAQIFKTLQTPLLS